MKDGLFHFMKLNIVWETTMRKFYVEETDTFIPEIETKVLQTTVTKNIRNDEITIEGEKRIIIGTNKEVFDENILNENAVKLFTKYSIKHGLMTSSDARELRADVNVSRKKFSNMVGISEMSVMFIETGSLISNHGNAMLREFKEAWNNAKSMEYTDVQEL